MNELEKVEKARKELIASFIETGYTEEQATETVNKLFGVIK